MNETAEKLVWYAKTVKIYAVIKEKNQGSLGSKREYLCMKIKKSIYTSSYPVYISWS